jgi:hypothetical protein
METENASADADPEAQRIAEELNRLYQDGAIANKSVRDPDARFYAKLAARLRCDLHWPTESEPS